MSDGPFKLPPGGGEGAPKRKRQTFGPVPKCGECTTCLRPTLKKSCLRNRPPQASGGGGSYAAQRPQQPPQPSVLESLPRPDQEKPVVPRGVAGFKLPIVPQQRPRKWSRQWCVALPPRALLWGAHRARRRAEGLRRMQGASGAAGAWRPALLGAALDARCVAAQPSPQPCAQPHLRGSQRLPPRRWRRGWRRVARRAARR